MTSERVKQSEGREENVCGFCKGLPVGNAASWLDGKPRPPAACPRCGEVNYPKEEQECES